MYLNTNLNSILKREKLKLKNIRVEMDSAHYGVYYVKFERLIILK